MSAAIAEFAHDTKREPLFPTVITSSVRAIFNACPEKFYNSILCGLVPRGYGNVHFAAGGAYAKALEAFRKEYFASGDYDRAVALGFVALVRSYGTFVPAEGETKTFDRTVAAFVEYLVRYPPQSDHIKPIIGELGPKVEFSFAFEIPGCFHPVTGDQLLFGGTLDQLVEFNSLLFIYDDKTTGAMGPMWKRQWDMRSQFTGYVYGIQNARPDIASRIAGAIIRGMCILKESCKSEEVITFRPQWMVERWKRRLVWDTQRMIQCWKDNYWPNTGEENGECTKFGVCSFHTLCTSQYPDNFLAVEYEVVRKDPITHELEAKEKS